MDQVGDGLISNTAQFVVMKEHFLQIWATDVCSAIAQIYQYSGFNGQLWSKHWKLYNTRVSINVHTVQWIEWTISSLTIESRWWNGWNNVSRFTHFNCSFIFFNFY